MPHWDQLTLTTIALFIAGLVYDAGRKAERLHQLEKWRTRIDGAINDTAAALTEIKVLLVGKADRRDQ